MLEVNVPLALLARALADKHSGAKLEDGGNVFGKATPDATNPATRTCTVRYRPASSD
jgi:hypothetical protein